MSLDDGEARRRLFLYTLARLCGLAIFFFGVACVYTDIVRPGGWPQLGAIIAIVGVLDAMFIPRVLKRAWEKQDGRPE